MAPGRPAAAAAEASPEPLEVRCAGCGETLEVEPGLTEFICPDCAMPQSLPPELMPPPPPRRKALPLPRGAADVRGARLPCGACGALLSVPVGLARCACPICGAELAVDTERLRHYLLSSAAVEGAIPVVPIGASSSPPILQVREVHEEHPNVVSRTGLIQAEPNNQLNCMGQAQTKRPNQLILEQTEPYHHSDCMIDGEGIHEANEIITRYHKQRNRESIGHGIITAEKRQEKPLNKFRHQAQDQHSSYALCTKKTHLDRRDRVNEAHADAIDPTVFSESGCIALINETNTMRINCTTVLSVGPKPINIDKNHSQAPNPKQIIQKQPTYIAISSENAQDKDADGAIHVQEKQRGTVNQANHTQEACTQLDNQIVAGHSSRRVRCSEKEQSEPFSSTIRKRKMKSLVANSSSGLELRRSKRLAKDSPAAKDKEHDKNKFFELQVSQNDQVSPLVMDTESIHRDLVESQAASSTGHMAAAITDSEPSESEPDDLYEPSPDQGLSNSPDIDRIINICPSSSPRHEIPEKGSDDFDNFQLTTPPHSSRIDMSDPECFARNYIPEEVRKALGKLRSKSLFENVMSQASSGDVHVLTDSEEHDEPWTMAHQNVGTKRNQGRGRGLTLCLKVWTLPKDVRIPVLLNASGEPIGKEAGTLSSFLGALARDGILSPLTHQDWRRVPEKNKDVMYHIVKLKFDIAPVAEFWILKCIGKKWKSWKALLKQKHYDMHETVEERLADRNPRVLKEQWQYLVAYWAEILEVRCAGCGETLEVERGLMEFVCPDCATPQSLPPELMPPPPPPRQRALPLPRGAADAWGARLPCGSCGELLSVPVGLSRCACPLCGAELAVDSARLRNYILSSAAAAAVPLACSSAQPILGAREVYFDRQSKRIGRHGKPETRTGVDSNLTLKKQDLLVSPNQLGHINQKHVPPNYEAQKKHIEVKNCKQPANQAQKKNRKGLMASSNSGLQLRCSKRLAKDSVAVVENEPVESDPVDLQVSSPNCQVAAVAISSEPIEQEPIQHQSPSPNCEVSVSMTAAKSVESEHHEDCAFSLHQSMSDPPDIDRIVAGLCHSTSSVHEKPREISSEPDDLDLATTPSNPDMSDPERFAQHYCQIFPLEVRRALAKKTSNSSLDRLTSEECSDEEFLHDFPDIEQARDCQKPPGQHIGSKRKKVQGRGPTIYVKMWTLPEGVRLPVSLNNSGLPIGKNAAMFGNFLGTLAQDGILAPLSYQKWKSIPKENKDAMWHIVKLKFDVAPSSESLLLKCLRTKWRNWRCNLKRKHFDSHKTEEERLADCDPRVLKEQWRYLVSYWNTEEAKAASARCKASRAKSTYINTTGSKSFAWILDEESCSRDQARKRSDDLTAMGAKRRGRTHNYEPGACPSDLKEKAALKASFKEAVDAKKTAENEAATLRKKMMVMEESQKKLQEDLANMRNTVSAMQKMMSNGGLPDGLMGASTAPPSFQQVRCAGCRGVLAVAPGMTEFICPKCGMAQRLPPQLMPKPPSSSSSSSPASKSSSATPAPPAPAPPRRGAAPPQAQGVDPTKIQLPCANCQAVLNVPHGLARFRCPQCGVELAVDLAKLQDFLASSNNAAAPPDPAATVPPASGPELRAPSVPVPPLVPFLPVLKPGMTQTPQLVPGALIPMVLPITDPPEVINEVAIDVEREEDEGGTVGETFTDYRPPKLSLGLPHPDPIVETSSLSAVQPPEPTYSLNIMDELDETKALSCLQIETLVYACQRHLYHLPTGDRAGFFIGDGAGVGKGRTIAGLIWENWQQGRHKAVWVSIGSDLKYDARRDLDDVGAKCVQVHPLNKLPYSKLDSKAIGIKNGVIFVTYSSLIASSERGRSRLQQLVQWCGQEFDGLLVFDECHKAKNLIPDAGSQPTRTGKAVLEIQEKLPEARVVYCSATGASEPRNLGYMVRLGLWGDGTSFQNFPQFLGSLEKGGVGALELVAMDMKARGMYVCRTLSYKGVDFDIVEAPLEERMMNMYRKAAEFWAEFRLELLSAGESFTEGISNQIWRLYWASHQRFFRHMCMSAKVPAVVKLAKEALAENKCVVVGLQSTGEARTEEAITKYGVEMEDFVSGPRELLLKLVEENYPLPPKPDSFQQGEEKVTEINRKRHSAPDVSFKGRVRKVAKVVEVSDDDSDDYSPCKFIGNYLILVSGANNVANIYCLLQLQSVLLSLIYSSYLC
ncbi:hypothetical protein E2562_033825 [Oryza meyeriana var. granulata]|uniref:Uncharacterized protein n=1 Tax=Oryza meyeriana var. granulata TaxID=110450 RepID=A0A6G1F1B0_9ORYZ|nr:hypothetical protein E2562_033825 [Oryza meyeriana var. granulata]